MEATHSILSTKTLDASARSFIRSHGWSLKEEAFITTQPIPWDPPPIDARTVVVFTSAAGVVRVDAHPWVACLSGQTLDAVRKRLPTAKVVCTAGNAHALARAVVADGRFSKAVFFCARAHRPELPDILREAHMDVTEVPVYDTLKTAKTIDTVYDTVLFFSPSGVDSFFQSNRLPENAVCFAIGETTANAIKEHTDTRIIVSGSPTQEDLLACVRFYYDNQPSNEHTAQ